MQGAHICLKFYEDLLSLGAVVKPPLTKRPSARQKTVGMKFVFEGGKRMPMKCGWCGVVGCHNKITCTSPI